jgi:hypothetical protein
VKEKIKIPAKVHDRKTLVRVARHLGVRLGTSSQAFSSTSEAADKTSEAAVGEISQAFSGPMSESMSSGKPVEIEYDTKDKPSVDLRKRPKGPIKSIKEFPGKVKGFWRDLFPIPTEEQRWNKLALREGRKYAKNAADILGSLGMEQILKDPNPQMPKRIKKIVFAGIWRDKFFNKIVLSVRLENKFRPDRVHFSDLSRDPLYSNELLMPMHHHTRWEGDEAALTLTVMRKGVDGLPPQIGIEKVWEQTPDTAPQFAIPVGVSQNSATHFIDPTEFCHLLVTGSTGKGKSNFVNQLLNYWLKRGLTPAELQLVLFDLKAGMEFSDYENIPHLYRDEVITTGILYSIDQFMPAMRQLQLVLERRMNKIKLSGHKNLVEYNQACKPADKMPTIFLVIDEWALIRLSRSGQGQSASDKVATKLADEVAEHILKEGIGNDLEKLAAAENEFAKQVLKLRQSRHFGLEAEDRLSKFAAIARAGGMFCILATQHPSAEIINGLIRCVFSTKVVFSTSIGGSMSALGDQSAVGLSVPGRAILEYQGDHVLLQTPEIKHSQIKNIIRDVKAGKKMSLSDSTEIGIEDILRYALTQFDGDLDYRRLWENFRSQGVGRDWLKGELRKLDGKEIFISGTAYKIVLPKDHSTARKLIKA